MNATTNYGGSYLNTKVVSFGLVVVSYGEEYKKNIFFAFGLSAALAAILLGIAFVLIVIVTHVSRKQEKHRQENMQKQESKVDMSGTHATSASTTSALTEV